MNSGDWERVIMELTSSSFAESQEIPRRHGKKAENVSPSLSWTGAPTQTRSFALALTDRISPGNVYVHWMWCDIPAAVTFVEDGASGAGRMPAGTRELTAYVGPFPPSGTHVYEFSLYALDIDHLDAPTGASLAMFEHAVEGHALTTARLSGTYTKVQT